MLRKNADEDRPPNLLLPVKQQEAKVLLWVVADHRDLSVALSSWVVVAAQCLKVAQTAMDEDDGEETAAPLLDPSLDLVLVPITLVQSCENEVPIDQFSTRMP